MTETAEAVRTMTNVAPYPDALDDLVKRCRYKDWTVELLDLDRDQGSVGLTLVITSNTEDSYAPPLDRSLVQATVCGMPHPRRIRVRHFFIVPAASYDRRAWQRWLFDQCVLVEIHEAMEMFKIDGVRMYAPNHGPGRNPYSILERGSEEDANTDQRGNPAYRPA
jgi:hypothetical protein